MRRIKSQGLMPALYAVRSGNGYYATLLGYVFGHSKVHAEQLAAAFYGHLADSGEETKVSWAGYPTLKSYNRAVAKMRKAAESTRADLEARIVKLKKELADDEARLAASSMTLMTQLEDFGLTAADEEPAAAAAK
jgi:hypothetical protein